jgi:UDP-glucose 4-epimerase
MDHNAKQDAYIITGSEGFIGSNLVELLESKNIKCLNVDLAVGKDILNLDKLSRIFLELQYKYNLLGIFHLAAISRIPDSVNSPWTTIQTNVQGTNNVLNLARLLQLKIVYAGSSSFYAGPMLNVYAMSKHMGEDICSMYSKCYGVKTAVARLFNVYGDHAYNLNFKDSLILNQFKRNYLEYLPFFIFGDGEQRRDFVHVKDVASALFTLMTSEASIANDATPIDVGNGKNYSVKEIVNMFSYDNIVYQDIRSQEARHSLANPTVLKSLGWTPKYTLEDYIDSIIRQKKNG